MHNGEACPAVFRQAASLLLATCLTYSSTLKLEAVCSSETSISSYRATLHYTPEYSTLHELLCETHGSPLQRAVV
jgi:hypothetical protein